MPTAVTLNLVDYSNEPTHSKFYISTLTSGNIVAQEAIAEAVRLAIEAISLCNEKSMTATLPLHTASGIAPTNVLAQRELAIRVFYKDNTNSRTGSLTIPGPDLTAVTVTGDEVLVADAGLMAALATALSVTNSRDGNNITVTRAVVVGRNN